MLVTLKTDRATTTSYQQAGEVVDLPDSEAMALIRSGSAEHVEPESAMVESRTETATIHRARPRRRVNG